MRSWIVATVLALSLPAVANECTAPEDKKLLYFVLDTAIARNEEMPSKERISRYADAISAADGKKDRMAKNLACVLLASSLSFAGQIDSRIDLLAGCSSKTIELARQREYPGAAPGFEEKHGDFLPIVRFPPEYPRKAREKGQSGVVVAIFTVTKGGRVKSPGSKTVGSIWVSIKSMPCNARMTPILLHNALESPKKCDEVTF